MAALNSFPGYGYRICRNESAVIDANNPSAGLVFSPPVDSDELFDGLRASYPTLKTHPQRKVQAIIDFLSAELTGTAGGHATAGSNAKTSRTQQSIVPTRLDIDECHTSDSHSDGQSSPATSQDSDRQPPNSQPTQSRGRYKPVPLAVNTVGSNATIPAMEQMVSIWRTSDGSAPTRKRRRQMNERERGEYKRKRQQGACDSCKMHKRKCTHQHKADEDTLQPIKRQRRHTNKRHTTVATPVPRVPSPAAIPPTPDISLQPQSFNVTQISDISSATLSHDEGHNPTQGFDAQVRMDTPLAPGGSVDGQTKQPMFSPSGEGDENDNENKHETENETLLEDGISSDDQVQYEYEKDLQYQSDSTSSEEE